jgi:hypothetical protein
MREKEERMNDESEDETTAPETEMRPGWQTVSVEALVSRGLLNLDELFDETDWAKIDKIEVYKGNDGLYYQVWLESARECGVVAFRYWADIANPYGGAFSHGDVGEITLSREEAFEEGQKYAAETDEE